MGFPEYEITHRKILFEGKDITHLPIEEKAKLGIALAFQNPPAIKGVKLFHLLKMIFKQPLDMNYFSPDSDFLEREINVGFSGEKKLSEIMQILSLNPKLVIFDKIDAGLDIINLEKLMWIILDKLIRSGVSLLLITHRGSILQFLEKRVEHPIIQP
jgi:Fe-S cluster assembly ATP-binding protein